MTCSEGTSHPQLPFLALWPSGEEPALLMAKTPWETMSRVVPAESPGRRHLGRQWSPHCSRSITWDHACPEMRWIGLWDSWVLCLPQDMAPNPGKIRWKVQGEQRPKAPKDSGGLWTGAPARGGRLLYVRWRWKPGNRRDVAPWPQSPASQVWSLTLSSQRQQCPAGNSSNLPQEPVEQA